MDVFITTLLLGIVSGSIYALAATGVVLTYKTSGVLNLGYGAVAVFTTYIYWAFTDQVDGYGWPPWLGAVVVIALIAPAIGVFLDTQLFRRLEGQPQVISVIATVGLFVLLQGVVLAIWGGQTKTVPSLFPGGTVPLFGGANIGIDQIGIFAVAVASALGLGAMLRYTKIGVAFRAVVNNRPIAGLMGINTGFVSSLAWAMSIAFAALVGILFTPRFLLDPLLLPPFIIAFVLGAAVVGYLESLPLAWAGGIGLGIAQAIVIQYGGQRGVIGAFTLDKLVDALPFLMITVAVLVAPKALRTTGFGASFIVRTREVTRPAPPGARNTTAAVVFGLLALVPLALAGSWQLALIGGMANAIVFISLVMLTGYSGQISLGHTAFMGIAVFTAAHIVKDLGLSIWLAFPLGALAAAPAGALIGLIAVRLHGLFLALMTLAFAFMAHAMFFQDPGISGGEGGIPVPRPSGFTSVTGLYYLTLAGLIGAALLATSLRTGRTGRVLAGMRDSETATRSLGIPVTRYKILIFALSATIAGGGALLQAMILQQATTRTFFPFFALILVTLAVLGGIFHIGGAIAAGLLFGLYGPLTNLLPGGAAEVMREIQLILFGLGATLALAKNPEGLFGEMRRGGAAVLRLFGRARSRSAPEPVPVAGGQE